ncbi:MAG: PilZ domain-containing protein [Desulfosarcina sp.]|nr:PilZ domain-containing protein [Desulfobacterales bacterium]
MIKRIPPGSGRRIEKSRNTRRHTRTACSVETHFAANRQLFEGIIKNLSAGGTYIQVRGRFNVGSDVIVAGPFAINQGESKRHGKIIRLDGGGIAVRFLQ